jgi:hypothetical protein
MFSDIWLSAVWCTEHGGNISSRNGLLPELHDVVSQNAVMLTFTTDRSRILNPYSQALHDLPASNRVQITTFRLLIRVQS